MILLFIPIPAMIAIGIGLLALVSFAIWWKTIMTKLFGKKITMLGDEKTGKTVLHRFLRYGEFTVKYRTTFWSKHKKGVYKLEDLKLYIKEGEEYGGNLFESHHQEWKRLFKENDFCFYLMRVNDIFNGNNEYIRLVEKQLSLIYKWKKEISEQNTILIFIGTYSDKVEGFPKNYTLISNKLRDNLGTVWSKFNEPLIIGSLKDEEHTQILARQLLSIMKNHF